MDMMTKASCDVSLAFLRFRGSFVQFVICIALCHLQWLKLTSDDVKEQIHKLAKKGLTPSQIGWCATKTLKF